VLDAQRAALTMHEQGKFEMELTLDMPNPQKAQQAAAELTRGLTQARKQLDAVGIMIAMVAPDLMKQARTALDQLKPKVTAQKVTCSLSLDAKELEAAMKPLQALGQGLGGGGGPPRLPNQPQRPRR
jgi:hypothetical protein